MFQIVSNLDEMYPTGNYIEYITAANRLFPKKSENEVLQPTFTNSPSSSFSFFHSPSNQSVFGNRSSSSADSTSPESYPDISIPSQNSSSSEVGYHGRPQVNFSPMAETPYGTRRQRPIVGRKIMGNTEYSQSHTNFESPVPMSPVARSFEHEYELQNIPNTSPNSMKSMLFEQKNYTQNVFYELFPIENRAFEFKTPVKTTVSPLTANIACSSANISPISSNISSASATFANQSPTSVIFSNPSGTLGNFQNRSPSNYPIRMNTPNYTNRIPNPMNFSNQSNVARNINPNFPTPSNQFPRNSGFIRPNLSRFGQDSRDEKICTFCRKNGEAPMVYLNHCVKERVDNKHIVTCPILRSHTCTMCGATGDDAHTITYCPVLRSTNNGLPLQSTTITLKNTRLKSNDGKQAHGLPDGDRLWQHIYACDIEGSTLKLPTVYKSNHFFLEQPHTVVHYICYRKGFASRAM